jgi:hypothetical protein
MKRVIDTSNLVMMVETMLRKRKRAIEQLLMIT